MSLVEPRAAAHINSHARARSCIPKQGESRPLPEPNRRPERRSHLVPTPSPTILRPQPRRGQANTFPSRSCPGTIAPIYRLVPPACERHGNNRFALSLAAKGPPETRSAVQKAEGSHFPARSGLALSAASTAAVLGEGTWAVPDAGPAPDGWPRPARFGSRLVSEDVLFLQAATPCSLGFRRKRGAHCPVNPPHPLEGSRVNFFPPSHPHPHLPTSHHPTFPGAGTPC